jgi:4-carboxymuconolactone decarboxylase
VTHPDTGLDPETAALVGLAAAIAQGEEPEIRRRATAAVDAGLPATWGDELLLQSVLMVGWPRTLVAAGIWRKTIGLGATGGDDDLDYAAHAEWTARGEVTCRLVYGENYAKLRQNVRTLHPALDAWMLTEGYGRTMSRDGLDLRRREFCVIAQTAVLGTPHQLHSHLRGALHAGASPAEITAVLAEVHPFLNHDDWKGVKELWDRVEETWSRFE